MAAIYLTGGSYKARAAIANAQRCINLIPELNPRDSQAPSPFTDASRPGLIGLGAPPTPSAGRCLYRATNGDLYGVVGSGVYYIDPNWKFNLLGAIAPKFTPAYMADNGASNGQNIVLVDGTAQGYQINMLSRQMTQIVDPSGLFAGSTIVQYFQTFFCFNLIGTNNLYTSLSEQVSFNALDVASKQTLADPIQTLITVQQILWVVGSMSAEPWYDAGGAIFPFALTPGQYGPHGTIAPYSIWSTDVNAGWLSQDKDGRAIALKAEGYALKRISTHALETEWLTYPRRDDCVCYTYQQAGHTIIVFHFPSADKSWGYDLSTDLWHQRCWIDNNGVLHRERVMFHAMAYDTNVGMDWQTGQIYALSLTNYTDAGQPIAFVRTFPHSVAEMKEVTGVSFVADMQTGTLPGTTNQTQFLSPFSSGFSSGFGPITQVEKPTIALRYSNDGGATWTPHRKKGLVAAGDYRSLLRWRGLGMARDRVYELSGSAPFLAAINGAFLDTMGHGA